MSGSPLRPPSTSVHKVTTLDRDSLRALAWTENGHECDLDQRGEGQSVYSFVSGLLLRQTRFHSPDYSRSSPRSGTPGPRHEGLGGGGPKGSTTRPTLRFVGGLRCRKELDPYVHPDTILFSRSTDLKKDLTPFYIYTQI